MKINNTTIKIMILNDWYENTYIINDSDGNAIIIDPGCNTESGELKLSQYIEKNELKLKALINTHCHIDHILGNKFIADKYDLQLQAHQGEAIVLAQGERVADMYGVQYVVSPPITVFLEHGQKVEIGNLKFEILFTPGHSPASICLYFREDDFVIGGDVLFRESIGRTDLPGGDFDTLITSIKRELFSLPEETVVYPGHGESTTIGYEKKNNSFLLNS